MRFLVRWSPVLVAAVIVWMWLGGSLRREFDTPPARVGDELASEVSGDASHAADRVSTALESIKQIVRGSASLGDVSSLQGSKLSSALQAQVRTHPEISAWFVFDTRSSGAVLFRSPADQSVDSAWSPIVGTVRDGKDLYVADAPLRGPSGLILRAAAVVTETVTTTQRWKPAVTTTRRSGVVGVEVNWIQFISHVLPEADGEDLMLLDDTDHILAGAPAPDLGKATPGFESDVRSAMHNTSTPYETAGASLRTFYAARRVSGASWRVVARRRIDLPPRGAPFSSRPPYRTLILSLLVLIVAGAASASLGAVPALGRPKPRAPAIPPGVPPAEIKSLAHEIERAAASRTIIPTADSDLDPIITVVNKIVRDARTIAERAEFVERTAREREQARETPRPMEGEATSRSEREMLLSSPAAPPMPPPAPAPIPPPPPAKSEATSRSERETLFAAPSAPPPPPRAAASPPPPAPPPPAPSLPTAPPAIPTPPKPSIPPAPVAPRTEAEKIPPVANETRQANLPASPPTPVASVGSPPTPPAPKPAPPAAPPAAPAFRVTHTDDMFGSGPKPPAQPPPLQPPPPATIAPAPSAPAASLPTPPKLTAPPAPAPLSPAPPTPAPPPSPVELKTDDRMANDFLTWKEKQAAVPAPVKAPTPIAAPPTPAAPPPPAASAPDKEAEGFLAWKSMPLGPRPAPVPTAPPEKISVNDLFGSSTPAPAAPAAPAPLGGAFEIVTPPPIVKPMAWNQEQPPAAPMPPKPDGGVLASELAGSAPAARVADNGAVAAKMREGVQKCLNELVDSMGYDVSMALFLEADGLGLGNAVGSYGLSPDLLKSVRIPANEQGGIVAHVVGSGRAALATVEQLDPAKDRAVTKALGTVGFGAVPFSDHERVRGVILFGNVDDARPLRDADLERVKGRAAALETELRTSPA